MSKSQRTKGASGERELCALLSDAFGEKITRRLGQARDSGHDVDLLPFRIECKRRKRIAGLYEWIAQAAGALGPNATRVLYPFPTVMLRADNEEWLVVMRFTDWCTIAREEIVAKHLRRAA